MSEAEVKTIICPNCSAMVPADNKFCGVCGTQLAASVAAPQASGATTQAAPPAPRSKGVADSRRLVTVLFADIAGFTNMAEKLDPEEVKHISDQCLTLLASVVAEYDGTVDKYMGDNIMVLFGAPSAHEDDPERAILCAVKMHEKLTDLSAALEQQRGFRLDLHIGINTGEVLAGAMGSSEVGSGDYTVMGDAVNVAARFQDLAEAGETVVGPTTYQLASHAFEFADLGALKVRGKRDAVRAWRVMSRKAERGSGRGLEGVGLSTPFVGRRKELARLRELLASAAAKRTIVCRLIGEAGAGKSRLIKELRDGSPGLRCYTGHCLPYTASTAYALVSDLVREMCAISPILRGEPAAAAVAQLCERLDLQKAQPSRSAIFCRLLDLPYADAVVRELRGSDFEQQLRDALVELLTALVGSEPRPVLLILEDVHWADRYSLAALARLPLIPRLMLLFTHRLGQGPALLPASDEEATIELNTLSDAESEQLVSAALAIDSLPNEVAQQIKERGGGNPFFIEELLKLLLQSGAIVNEGGQWRFTADPASFRVPPSVQEVIQGRIDRLNESQRTLLQTAATAGRVFSHRLMQKLLGADDSNLDYNLEALTEQLLTVPLAGQRQEYAFRHALIQEVAYQSVLQSERRKLHAQIADALVALYPEQRGEHSGVVDVIARHYSESDDHKGAATYLMRAGRRAWSLYATEEATDYYRRALERQKLLAAANPDERLRWGLAQLEAYTALVDITTLTGQLDEAERYGDAGVELAAFLLPLAHEAEAYRQTSEQIAELCVRLAQLYGQRRGLADKTLEYVAIGERALGDKRGRAWARLQVAGAQAYFLRFQPEQMAQRVERALPILKRENDLPWLAMAYYTLGTAATFRGGMEQVHQMRSRSLAIFEELGDLRGMLTGYLSNGVMLGDMLRYDEALVALDRAEELAERLKSRDSLAKAQVWRGLIHLALGELDIAQAYTRRAIAMAEENGYQAVYLDGLTYTGEIEYARGNFATALDMWEQGLTASEGKVLWTADYQLRIARTLARLGRPSEAEAMIQAATSAETQASTMIQTTMLHADAEMWLDHSQRALEMVNEALATGVSSPRNVILYRMLRAMLLLDLGETDSAEAEATALLDDAMRHHLQMEQGICERVIGQALLSRGEVEEGRQRLAQSALIFTRTGMKAEAETSRIAYEQAEAGVK